VQRTANEVSEQQIPSQKKKKKKKIYTTDNKKNTTEKNPLNHDGRGRTKATEKLDGSRQKGSGVSRQKQQKKNAWRQGGLHTKKLTGVRGGIFKSFDTQVFRMESMRSDWVDRRRPRL